MKAHSLHRKSLWRTFRSLEGNDWDQLGIQKPIARPAVDFFSGHIFDLVCEIQPFKDTNQIVSFLK